MSYVEETARRWEPHVMFLDLGCSCVLELITTNDQRISMGLNGLYLHTVCTATDEFASMKE